MNYKISNQLPTPEEYCHMRQITGLAPKTIEAATVSLPRSLFMVTIREEEKLIAMGRAIGDLGCHVQIVDIAVHPDYQGKKLGNIIMDNVMEFVKKECHRCAFVNLFADVDFLYGKYGFVPSLKSKGMYLDWNSPKLD